MSFGDHLDELRSCLIRSVLAVAACSILCLVFGTEIVRIIYRPLNLAQHSEGLAMELQALSPMTPFTTYLKVAMLSGVLIAMPVVLHQTWRFVSVGLFPHERRFAYRLMPASVGLFAVGVLFLYFVVLPIVLTFFITFNTKYGVPQFPVEPVALVEGPAVAVPIVTDAPPNPKEGDMWVDGATQRLVIKLHDGVWSTRLERGARAGGVRSDFAIDFYVSFVLRLALAFGIAFELPIVVFFLAWTRIVSTATMAGARRYVLLGIVIAAAIFTPPDVISQMLLAVPMYALFELGLLAGRMVERKATHE